MTINDIYLIHNATSLIALCLLAIWIFFNVKNKDFSCLVYFFVFLQPVLITIANYLTYRQFDPFYMFVDVCLLCGGLYDYYINFLRIAFYGVTAFILAPYIKQIVKYREYFLFFTFYSLSVYVFGVLLVSKFSFILFWVIQILVLIPVFKKLKEVFKPKFKI